MAVNQTTKCLQLLTALISFLCSVSALGQPIANFNSNIITGCAPLSVKFKDLSTGNPDSWQWNLGNGTLSTQQNPVTTYFNPGFYTISLIAGNGTGNTSITKNRYIIVYDKPSVNFIASDSTGCLPLKVSFTDLSSGISGNIVSWTWDFGDGNTAVIKNPVHTYTISGNYTVSLKETNSNGCVKVFSKPNYINVSQNVQAAFTNTIPVLCHPPESISFNNLTTGPGTLSYEWNFGDGSGSASLKNPVYQYAVNGNFSVTLIAHSNIGCSDTLQKTNAIVIKNTHSAFLAIDSVCTGIAATFNNTSFPVPVSSSWDFGDGTTSLSVKPVKSWMIPGVYQARLINNYGTCYDTASKSVAVMTNPKVNFKVDDSIGCHAPAIRYFHDLSSNSAKWIWDFGDGITSNLQDPTHQYNDTGSFTVKLISISSFGCTGNFVKNQYIKIISPSVTINNTVTEGCIPFTFKPAAKAKAIDGIAGYLWDFGDGSTSTLPAPTHIYPVQGAYKVKLTITTGDGCIDSTSIKDSVRTGTLPAPNFNAVPLAQCTGQNISFTDLSIAADKWLWNFGDGGSSDGKNPQYAFQDTGNFTITLKVWNNGCSNSITKNNLVKSFPPVAKFLPVYNCANKLQVLFTDKSVLPQTWYWNFGDGTYDTVSNPIHTFPALGSYTVTLTVTNSGCSNSKTMLIKTVDEIPDFSILNNIICRRDTITFKTINIDKTNITGYDWDFGDSLVLTTIKNSITHQYVSPGTYTAALTITDIHGCKTFVTKPNLVTVYGPAAGFIASSFTGCKGFATDFTDNSVTDGMHAITNRVLTYGDGSTDNLTAVITNHIYSTAGNFTVRLKVTDNYGCTDTISLKTPIYITNPKAGFSSKNTVSCAGSPIAFNNTSTGTGLTYEWDLGGGLTSDRTIPAITYSSDGNYKIKLVVKDLNGCKDSIQIDNYITVKTAKALFTVSDSVSSCIPFEASFTNKSINSVDQKWDFGDGTFSSSNSPLHYYTSPGTYLVTLYVKGNGGCTDSLKQHIYLFAPAAVLTYTPLTGCSPMPASFHVSSAGRFKYTWDMGDGNSLVTTDSNLVYNYFLPGDFVPKVILEEAGGCQIPVIGDDTIRVTKSDVNFSVNNSFFCDTGVAVFSDLTSSNGTIDKYNWDFGNGTASSLKNPSCNYTATGIYTVKLVIQTSNGCSDTLVKNDYINITASPVTDIQGITVGCEKDTLQYKGIILSGDTSALLWHWNLGNGNTSSLQNPPPQQYPRQGNYPLQLTTTNNNGCSNIVNKTITIHPLPFTSAGSDTILCLGTALQLKATGATNYSWYPPDDLSCSACAAPFSNAVTDTRYFVKGTNTFGCQKTDSILVHIKNPFILTATPVADSICKGQEILLNASGAEKYIWFPSTGLSNPAINNPVASPESSTSYQVIGSDSAGCFKDTVTVKINVFDYPVVIAGDNLNVSVDSSIQLFPRYSADIVKWEWRPITGLSCDNCADPYISPLHNTTYTVQVTNNGGCTSSDNITVIVDCNKDKIFLPNTFSPNNDGINDRFYPRGKALYNIQSLIIFNRWGAIVYQNKNFPANDASFGWDGFYKGNPVAAGIYTYMVEIICENNKSLTFYGNIALLQ